MRRTLLALTLALAPTVAHAQLLQIGNPDIPQGFKMPLSILAIAGTTDLVSTFTSHSNYESNPVVSWMQPKLGFEWTVMAGIVIREIAIDQLCDHLCESKPKLAKTLMYVASGVHFYYAGRNWANRNNHYAQLYGRKP